MAEYKVAVIPGDGVGLEVIGEGRKALEANPLPHNRNRRS